MNEIIMGALLIISLTCYIVGVVKKQKEYIRNNESN